MAEINKAQVRRSMRASYNQLIKSHDNLGQLLMTDADFVQGTSIGDIRDEVEAMTKSFYEFSAYWNVYNTHTEPKA